MTEYEIYALFNGAMTSTAIFGAANIFLLWVAFRGVLRIQDQGATVFQKVLSTIFSLGIVFLKLQTLAFVRVNFESTAFDLSQLPELSDRAQRFVEFVGAEEVTFSLIPNNPILFVWWIAVLVILLGSTWLKPSN